MRYRTEIVDPRRPLRLPPAPRLPPRRPRRRHRPCRRRPSPPTRPPTRGDPDRQDIEWWDEFDEEAGRPTGVIERRPRLSGPGGFELAEGPDLGDDRRLGRQPLDAAGAEEAGDPAGRRGRPRPRRPARRSGRRGRGPGRRARTANAASAIAWTRAAAVGQVDRRLRADHPLGRQADVRHEDVGPGLGHRPGLGLVVDVGAGQEVHCPRLGNHVDLAGHSPSPSPPAPGGSGRRPARRSGSSGPRRTRRRGPRPGTAP